MAVLRKNFHCGSELGDPIFTFTALSAAFFAAIICPFRKTKSQNQRSFRAFALAHGSGFFRCIQLRFRSCIARRTVGTDAAPWRKALWSLSCTHTPGNIKTLVHLLARLPPFLLAEQAGLEPAHRNPPVNGLAIRRSTCYAYCPVFGAGGWGRTSSLRLITTPLRLLSYTSILLFFMTAFSKPPRPFPLYPLPGQSQNSLLRIVYILYII